MKLITSSVAFQSPSGVVAANGYLLLTLQQNATLIGGGQIFSTIPTRIKLDATGKIPAGTQIIASDEMVTQIPYTADLQDSNMSRLDTLGIWAIVGASPIDLSLMTSTSSGVSFPGAVLLNPVGNQTILTNNLILALGDFATTVGGATLAGNLSVGGTSTLSGNVTATAGQNTLKAYSINSCIWLDGIKYTTLVGAYTDIPSTGGIVMVPPNYSETLSADLTLSKPNAGFCFMGPATITLGTHQIIINPVSGAFIVGQAATGAKILGTSSFTSGGLQFIYTGTTTAIVAGSASTTPVAGLRLVNFALDIVGAGSSTIGINLKNTHGGGELTNLLIDGTGGATSQVGIQCDDGGSFTGNLTITGCQFHAVKQGILFNGASQEIAMYGNQFWGGSTSGIAIDLEGAQWGIQSWGGNIDGYATCVKMASTASYNYIAMPMGTFTTMVNFGSTTVRNTVQQLRTDTPVVTDSGSLNSVIWGGTRSGTLLNAQGALAALTGNNADQTVYTYTIPAGTIQPGKGFRVTVFYVHTTGNGLVTYKMKLGSTALDTQAVTDNANAVSEMWQGTIMNNAAVQNAQTWSRLFYFGAVAAVSSGVTAGTSAENTANALALTWTFNAANTEQVTAKQWYVELIG